MTPQQKERIHNALVKLYNYINAEQREAKIWQDMDKMDNVHEAYGVYRAAIKELEAMPTEEV